MLWLQTSLGPFQIVVCDWLCPSCGMRNAYEGADRSIFVATKYCALSTQLLSEWMLSVVVGGCPFRSMYATWFKKISQDPLLLDVRADYSSLGDIPGLVPREQASSAFYSYLHLLDASVGNSLEPLFGCATCEYRDAMGRKRIRSIGIDGTAIGHLSPFDNGSAKTSGNVAGVFVKPLARKSMRSLYLLGGLHEREGLRRVLARLHRYSSS